MAFSERNRGDDTMKERLIFLHFLYIDTKIEKIVESRILNDRFDTTQLIGCSPPERRMVLNALYGNMANKLPKGLGHQKKESSFSANII